jgi:hypothetical protein
MDIGEKEKIYTITPVENPIRRDTPAPKEPVKVPEREREPEKV